MAKFAASLFCILACLLSLSCSPYTKGLQQSVARADEVTAISSMRTISMAQQTHAVGNDGAFANFRELAEAGYLESRFNSDAPQIKGYVFTMTVRPKSGASPDFFSCNADPVGSGDTKGRYLYLDSTSPEIKVNATQPASAEDPAYHP